MSVLTVGGINSIIEYLPYFQEKVNCLYKVRESGEKGVFLMDPYDYSTDVMGFLEVLYETNFIGPEFNTDKARSRAGEYAKNPELISSADLKVLREILTVGVRSDRFCSGVVAGMIDDGIITRCLQRLETIRSKMKEGLGPLVSPDKDTTTMLMGTLPGDESLGSNEYFADKRNDFWRLLGGAWGMDMVPLGYDEKKRILYEHGIGIWDVYSAGERKGSSGKIKNGLLNDFSELKTIAPGLQCVLLLGVEAGSFEGVFKELGYKTDVLLQPSSANRRPGRADEWKNALNWE